MEIRSWTDVFKAISKDCKKDPLLPDLSVEDVEQMHKHLWDTIAYYLRNPLLAKGGLLVNEIFKFDFRVEFMEKEIKRLEEAGKAGGQNHTLYTTLIQHKNGTKQAEQQIVDK